MSVTRSATIDDAAPIMHLTVLRVCVYFFFHVRVVGTIVFPEKVM